MVLGETLEEAVIGALLSADIDIVTRFLGYKPDDEVFNNNQLLEEEVNNIASQMPDDILQKFYNECNERNLVNQMKNDSEIIIEDLCRELSQYQAKLKSCGRSDISDEIEKLIIKIKN